jgi:hypothetical protein
VIGRHGFPVGPHPSDGGAAQDGAALAPHGGPSGVHGTAPSGPRRLGGPPCGVLFSLSWDSATVGRIAGAAVLDRRGSPPVRSRLAAGEGTARARSRTAPQAVDLIHTDLRRGFIRSEVVSYDSGVAHANRGRRRSTRSASWLARLSWRRTTQPDSRESRPLPMPPIRLMHPLA